MKDQSHQPRMQRRKTAYAYGRSAQERFGLLVLGLDPRKDGTGLFVRMELNESDDEQSPCPAMEIGYAYDAKRSWPIQAWAAGNLSGKVGHTTW